MDKENKGTPEDGGAAPTAAPGGELTREQVMAQRAEKKKLKEARKNKSGGGGDTPKGPGAGDSGDKPKPPKEKKPQQQQQQQQQQRQPKKDKVQKENVKTAQESQQQTAKPPPKAKEQTPTPKDKESTPPKALKERKLQDSASPNLATDKSAGDNVPKATDSPEKTVKTPSDFQSRIQSLFHVKKGAESAKNKNFQLHPLFQSLGVKLRNNVVRETNQRCIALLRTIKEYVSDYQTPQGHSFKHGLSNDLRLNLDALREKCPFAIGMNNAVEFLNAFLYKMDQDVSDVEEKKEEIKEVIEQYIEEKIEKAVEAIVIHGTEKISTGDVIMIYSVTEAVVSLLEKAVSLDGSEKKTFEIIVIQTPETMMDLPLLVKKLNGPIQKREIIISYVIFPNAIYRMRHCTKLIIGGHGLFTTGGVMAQSGSAELALLASTYNKPTIFLCETYKFCDRSPLDFFTLDEYIPEQSVTDEGLFQPKIRYDVTPANLVTVVVTDIELLPSTSVPVVLRVQEGRAPRKTGDVMESP